MHASRRFAAPLLRQVHLAEERLVAGVALKFIGNLGCVVRRVLLYQLSKGCIRLGSASQHVIHHSQTDRAVRI
jgi:hypothetical protein